LQKEIPLFLYKNVFRELGTNFDLLYSEKK
jgi:hypothetical protein